MSSIISLISLYDGANIATFPGVFSTIDCMCFLILTVFSILLPVILDVTSVATTIGRLNFSNGDS